MGEKRYAKWGSQNFGVPGLVFWVVFQGIILWRFSFGMCTGHNHERLHFFFGPNLQGKALPKESKKLDTPTMTRYKVARIDNNSMKLLSDN